jgi:hypothetical protein
MTREETMSKFPCEFEPGRRVLYVPNHAHGDQGHPDVEAGTITSINPVFVFVRFGAETHSKACDPNTLVYESHAVGEEK